MVDFIEKRQKVEFVLIVEKECTFDILCAIKFHIKHHCVIITGKGYPTIATRSVVRKLKDTLMVPVYGLSDLDRSGLEILCTYKFGSRNCAYDNLDLSVPSLIWLGVHPEDFIEEGGEIPTPNLSDADHEIIKRFLESLPVGIESKKILDMLNARICRDIHNKLHRDNIEAYIIEKIEENQEVEATEVGSKAGRGEGRGGISKGGGGRGRRRGGGSRNRGRGRGKGCKGRGKVRGR